MKIDEYSLAFNCPGCPSWGTAVVEQDNQLRHLIKTEDAGGILLGMIHNQVPINTHDFYLPIGKGSRIYYGDTGFEGATSEPILVSLFKKTIINGVPIDYPFILILIKDRAEDHKGRLQLKYTPKAVYGEYNNAEFFKRVSKALDIEESTPIMIYDLDVDGQETLVMTAIYGETIEDINKGIDVYLKKKLGDAKKSKVSIINDAVSYREDELVQILSSWYDEAGPNAIRIFGLKFGAFFVDNNYSTSKFIGKCDNISQSYETELSKGIQMYKSVKSGEFGLYFYDDKYKKLNFEITKKQPVQLIYFGAPGTSKSATIKDKIGNSAQHRITFHPDTDYSSFVGCYKPTKEDETGEITYKFVAQTFIKAYVDAWKKLVDDNVENKIVFLVIEEINRGNCAQIFGDLFQLLDRDGNGFSDYSIEPDEDLKRYLGEEAFRGFTNLPEEISKGSVLRLPPNLYIWATMNTSDQSLFPIDSAFKRRWDWKYTPIKNAGYDHVIALKDRKYDWWEFLEAVNKRIEKVTESEDKQMGYWFAKPDNGIEISSEKFVSKVIFYLWNDVFKDYGHDANSPFVIKQDDGKKTELRFKSFFDEDGEVDEKTLILFFWGLKLETKAGVEKSEVVDSEQSSDANNESPLDTYEGGNIEPEVNAIRETQEDLFSDEEEDLPEAKSIDDFFKS